MAAVIYHTTNNKANVLRKQYVSHEMLDTIKEKLLQDSYSTVTISV